MFAVRNHSATDDPYFTVLMYSLPALFEFYRSVFLMRDVCRPIAPSISSPSNPKGIGLS